MTTYSRRSRAAADHDKFQNRITGKILFQAWLENLSPLLIGNGAGERADVEVVREASSGRPFIPATSLAGVIRQQLAEYELLTSEELNFFFGGTEGPGPKGQAIQMQASRIQFQDAVVEDAYQVRIRDSVRIHPVTATAEDTGKFDYEILERGSRFPVTWELTLRQDTPRDTARRLLGAICLLFDNQVCRLGAKTNAGFGRLKLMQPRYLELDFHNQLTAVKTWLLQSWQKPDFKGWQTDIDRLRDEHSPGLSTSGRFTFDGLFKITDSFIVRDDASDSDAHDSDAPMITSRNAPVLPGPSLKGALRHQATRIFNTFYAGVDHQKAFRHFFGHVATDPRPDGLSPSQPAIKSRLRVEEHIIQNPLLKLQQRNKIDRFTGGTVPTALFDCVPLWHQANCAVHVALEARIQHPWEAGLLLLVLKDLWLGRATVGGETGIGRGRLQGVDGTISYQDVTVALTATPETPLQLELSAGAGSPEEWLNRWVEDFWKLDQPSAV